MVTARERAGDGTAGEATETIGDQPFALFGGGQMGAEIVRKSDGGDGRGHGSIFPEIARRCRAALRGREKTRIEVAAVPAPRSLVGRHGAPFPREAGSWARKSRCSLLGMTSCLLGARVTTGVEGCVRANESRRR